MKFLFVFLVTFFLLLLPVYCWVNILVIFINFLSLPRSLLLCFSCIFIQLVQLQEFPWLATRATPFFRHSLHALRESVIERHFGEGGVAEWAFGSEHLLHVTLLLLAGCAACNIVGATCCCRCCCCWRCFLFDSAYKCCNVQLLNSSAAAATFKWLRLPQKLCAFVPLKCNPQIVQNPEKRNFAISLEQQKQNKCGRKKKG